MKIGAMQIHRGRILPIFRYRPVRTAAGRGSAVEHCIALGLIDVGGAHTDQITLRAGCISFTEQGPSYLQAGQFTWPR